jgi:hypothetical protein
MDVPTFIENNDKQVKQVSGRWFEAFTDAEQDAIEHFERSIEAGLDFAIEGHMPYEAKIDGNTVYMRYKGHD